MADFDPPKPESISRLDSPPKAESISSGRISKMLERFNNSVDPDSPESVSSDRIEKNYGIYPPEQQLFMMNLNIRDFERHYDEMQALWRERYKHPVETVEFEIGMLKLIKNNPTAVASFKELFPTTTMIPVPGAGFDPDETVFVRQGGFMDRVRDAFYDNIEFYLDWLEKLDKYRKGSMCLDEFKFNVASLFENHPDLYKELDVNIDKSKTDQTDEETTTSTETEASVYVPPEPESKRRKTE